MSELHKFIFEGMPVRGMLVRLTGAWQDILARRAANTETGAYPPPVRDLLGEMAAAGVLMQGNIKFNGALVLQIAGDGPVKVAVVEVQPDLALRATCTRTAEVAEGASLSEMVNLFNQGRCVITLDPRDRLPGQQPYQGVVPLFGDRGEKLEHIAQVLEHYMLQSEQLDTVLVLAADAQVAAGLLIQRLPVQGQGNLQGQADRAQREDLLGRSEDFNRIALLARSLKRHELLTLDAETVLHRLFWDEPLARFEPLVGDKGPRFACSCSRQRVQRMIRSLGLQEAQSILAEQGQIEVGCDFCGTQYRFDPVDAVQIFTDNPDAPMADTVH